LENRDQTSLLAFGLRRLWQFTELQLSSDTSGPFGLSSHSNWA
jgi:hypothetical protein